MQFNCQRGRQIEVNFSLFFFTVCLVRWLGVMTSCIQIVYFQNRLDYTLKKITD